MQTPFRAPNANADADRFVRSIKHECLNRVIPLGERRLTIAHPPWGASAAFADVSVLAGSSIITLALRHLPI